MAKLTDIGYDVFDGHIFACLTLLDLLHLSQTSLWFRDAIDTRSNVWHRFSEMMLVRPACKERVVQSMHRFCNICGRVLRQHVYGEYDAARRECNASNDEHAPAPEQEVNHSGRGIFIGNSLGRFCRGIENICIGHGTDTPGSRTNFSIQIGSGCIGVASHTIHVGSSSYTNFVFMLGASGTVPQVAADVDDDELCEAAARVGVPIGGIFCRAHPAPPVLMIRRE